MLAGVYSLFIAPVVTCDVRTEFACGASPQPVPRLSRFSHYAVSLIHNPSGTTGVIAVDEAMMTPMPDRIDSGSRIFRCFLVGVIYDFLEVRYGVVAQRIR